MFNFIKVIRDKLSLPKKNSQNINSSINVSVTRRNIKESASLLILGNGFNLDMKFRTRYKDFYTRYLNDNNSVKYKNSELCRLLLDKNKNRQWADIEQVIKQFAIDSRTMTIDIEEEKAFFDYLVRELGFYMHGEDAFHSVPDDVCKFSPEMKPHKQDLETLDTLSLRLLRGIMQSEYKIKVLSFNYSDMQSIATTVAYGMVKHNNGNDVHSLRFCNDYHLAGKLTKEHFEFEYPHISGSKCVLGTDDDSKIPDYLSFMRKSAQLEPDAYSVDFSGYRYIIFFGFSFGECDSNFNKILFDKLCKMENKPKLVIITYDTESSTQIEDNMKKFMKDDLEQQLEYSFLFTRYGCEVCNYVKLAKILFQEK